MRYLQGTKDYMLTYKRLDNLEVIGYFDVDYGGCPVDYKSTSCYVFILAGGAIPWKSAKQTLTATSTMEAEYIACYEAMHQAIWLKNFMEFTPEESISRPLTIYCDNSTIVSFSHNNKSTK